MFLSTDESFKHTTKTLDELKKTWMAKEHDNCLFISAKQKENIEEFREVLYKKVRELHVQKYPYNDFLYNIEEQATID